MSLPRALAAALGCAAVLAAAALFRQPPAPPPGEPPAFAVEPYLQFATRTAMTVMCETEAAATCTVEYGDIYPPKLTATGEAGTLHEIKLTNLVPRTKYYYRVVCTDAAGRQLRGKDLTFFTAPDPGDAWSFVAIGDTQRNPAVTGKLAKLMWDRRPHFVLHTGDVVDDGPANWQWTGDFFAPCRDLFARVAVFPAIGNHEKNHAFYYKYFSLPAPEYRYSFRYGNAEFFSIDTNKTASLKADGEQYVWLDRALAASDTKWKVCFHHHPAYSSDADDYGNTAKAASTDGDLRVRPLVALYEKHNVDVVFNGHIHLYERSWPIRGNKVDPKTGVVYVTTGGGGGKLEEVGPVPTFFKAECRTDYHFLYVTVHGGALKAKTFDAEGRLFDSWELNK